MIQITALKGNAVVWITAPVGKGWITAPMGRGGGWIMAPVGKGWITAPMGGGLRLDYGSSGLVNGSISGSS